MQSNKLRMAIRSTAAVAILGVAAQANALELSAGDVDASLYGYARLNMSYDMDENIADPTQSGLFGNINGSDVDGHFGASANQSRLGVNLTNSDGVKVNIEGDFYAGNFRIRHAYGEYQGVLAGQTWSNFNSFVGNTSVLDFTSNAGLAGLQNRAAQIRYTTGALSFSAEDPRGGLNAANGAQSKDSMPVFTARYESTVDALSLSAAGLVKQNAHDTGTEDDTAIGMAVFGAAKMALSDMITLQGTVSYSNGANGYLYLSGADDAYVDGSGSLETISGVGGSLGTGIGLGGGRSINLGYGMTKVDWDDAEDDLGAAAVAGEAETNQNLFLNYQWTPVANTMMGVEYSYWDTENVNGDSEDANRILFAAQYNF